MCATNITSILAYSKGAEILSQGAFFQLISIDVMKPHDGPLCTVSNVVMLYNNCDNSNTSRVGREVSFLRQLFSFLVNVTRA